MRVKFAEGVWVDAYNLHADAGYVLPSDRLRLQLLKLLIVPLQQICQPGLPTFGRSLTTSRLTQSATQL
jgi:hypothetical protein